MKNILIGSLLLTLSQPLALVFAVYVNLLAGLLVAVAVTYFGSKMIIDEYNQIL